MNIQFPDQVRSLIMVDPQYFDVEYAINPFMRDDSGRLHKVDTAKARQEWKELQQIFTNLGLTVHTLRGEPGFPDMVFCANQSFPFLHPQSGEPCVLMSRMRAPQRSGEVVFFEKWYQENGYRIFHLEQEASFESNGDLIPVPGSAELWGGAGPRTEEKVYAEMRRRFGLKIESLELIHPHFYHLDTCFFVVNKNFCAYIPEAFSAASRVKITERFPQALEIPLQEGLSCFAGNAFSPDGKNVILQKGCARVNQMLREKGFQVIEVETSEYMKSGGSVFCMKMALPT